MKKNFNYKFANFFDKYKSHSKKGVKTEKSDQISISFPQKMVPKNLGQNGAFRGLSKKATCLWGLEAAKPHGQN